MKQPIMGEYSAQWTHNAGKSSDASTSNVGTARNERRSYKNISICITELPPTPTKFRDKYHRARVPHSKPPIVFKPGEGRTDRPWIGGYGAAHAHSIRRTQPAIPVVVRRPQTTQFRAIQPVHVVRRPQTDSIRIRGPKAIPEIGKRPQTHQLSPISTVCVIQGRTYSVSTAQIRHQQNPCRPCRQGLLYLKLPPYLRLLSQCILDRN